LNNKTLTALRYALLISGIALCLTGAALMIHGSVFGDNTTGIATITGIIGIGLISTSNLASGPKSFKSHGQTENGNGRR
jgi:hypothetical protein